MEAQTHPRVLDSLRPAELVKVQWKDHLWHARVQSGGHSAAPPVVEYKSAVVEQLLQIHGAVNGVHGHGVNACTVNGRSVSFPSVNVHSGVAAVPILAPQKTPLSGAEAARAVATRLRHRLPPAGRKGGIPAAVQHEGKAQITCDGNCGPRQVRR
jgi:hypothetical protein